LDTKSEINTASPLPTNPKVDATVRIELALKRRWLSEFHDSRHGLYNKFLCKYL